ncbi:MAG: DNA polymerase III subunit gamma/tau [Planctomycetaceae bacterium]|jgi:DNA polymerase-3 subunit gamma/tau|nr:DNA polymerase III subunit gamma/tau [Planctomycetaceae bacterium]
MQEEQVQAEPGTPVSGNLISGSTAKSGQYQVVARRYRPQGFEELVGQPHIVHALSNALTTGRVGHAYLFTGARGVGKTSSARIFAKALNCIHGPTITPCGECDSCVSIATGEDIDVLEIDAASNRGIEEIRQLRQNASIRPSRSRNKIYILDEVHMLTKEAFNALLKILEEPPEHIKFIFCTTEPGKIPITILSRCQRFDFAGIEAGQITERLAGIAQNEKVTADDGVFETLARRAGGSMRDAQSLLEQLLSFAPEHITLNDVNEMLGTANDQLLFRLMDGIMECKADILFAELESAAAQGVDFAVLVEQLMGLLRDFLVTVSGGNEKLLLFCQPQQFNEIKVKAAEFGIHRILAALQILDHTHTRMLRSTQTRILTELALVRIAHLEHFQQIAVLLDQLRSGQTAALPAPSVRPVHREIKPPRAEPVHTVNAAERPALERPAAISTGYDATWAEVADDVPGMLGTAAGQFTAVRFEEPNIFVPVFSNKLAKETCERESPRLQGALSQKLGRSMKVRFEFEAVEKPKSAAESENQTLSAKEERERFMAALDNPLVKTVQEVFATKLQRIEN